MNRTKISLGKRALDIEGVKCDQTSIQTRSTQMTKILMISDNIPGGVVELTGVKSDLSNVGEILVAMKLIPAPTARPQKRMRYLKYKPMPFPNKAQGARDRKLKQIGLNSTGDDCIFC